MRPTQIENLTTFVAILNYQGHYQIKKRLDYIPGLFAINLINFCFDILPNAPLKIVIRSKFSCKTYSFDPEI